MKSKTPLIATIIFAIFLSIAGCFDAKTENKTAVIDNKFGIQEAHYSLWDTGIYYDSGTVAQAKAMFDNLDQLNAKNFRYTIFWSAVERNADGVYDWSRHDELIPYLATKNLDISIMLHAENSSYYDPEKPAIVADAAYHTAWLNFMGAVVKRYGDKVRRWEIGNEEDSNQSWKPVANPAEYSAFLISTSIKIRSIQSDAFIIMGGVTPLPSDEVGYYGSRDFLTACFEAGVLNYVNAVGIHPYRSKPEGPFNWGFITSPLNASSFEEEIEYLKNLIAAKKPGIELWNTESGFFNPDYVDEDHQNKQLYGQVKLLSRFMLVDYAAGLKGLTYFRLRVNNQFPEAGQPMFQGLIEEDIGYIRPAFTAMKSICDIIGPNDVVFVKTIKTTGKINNIDENVRIEVYTKNGKNIIAYWLPEDIDNVQKAVKRINLNITAVLKLDYKVKDILYTDVEYADYTISESGGTVAFENLPVTDYPFILFEE